MSSLTKLSITASILLFLHLAFFGCEKIKDAVEFDVLYNLPQSRITVDSATFGVIGNEVVVLEQEITIDLDSIKRKHNLESFKSAKFDYIRVEAETPPSANLDWIKSLRASIVTSSLNETVVGSWNGTGSGARTIDLTLANTAITPYLLEGTFTLRIYAGVEPPLPASVISLLLNSRIRITVQPL